MKIEDTKHEIIIENVKQVNIQKQHVKIGSFKPHKGHTLFSVNSKTGEVKKAEFKVQDLTFNKALNKNYSKTKKVIIEDGCRYITALNIKNLFKKLGYKIKK